MFKVLKSFGLVLGALVMGTLIGGATVLLIVQISPELSRMVDYHIACVVSLLFTLQSGGLSYATNLMFPYPVKVEDPPSEITLMHLIEATGKGIMGCGLVSLASVVVFGVTYLWR